ncbi:hypothetical protein OG427_39385 [Streptomyces sp. NBC_00133]
MPDGGYGLTAEAARLFASSPREGVPEGVERYLVQFWPDDT